MWDANHVKAGSDHGKHSSAFIFAVLALEENVSSQHIPFDSNQNDLNAHHNHNYDFSEGFEDVITHIH